MDFTWPLFLICCITYLGEGGCSCSGNIAQGRPSFQSSDHHDVLWHANVANDGNFGTGASREPLGFSHTNYETQAWWAVHVGTKATVTGVQIVNRRDHADQPSVGERLSDFIVGMTDRDPTQTAPTPSTLKVCAEYPGKSHGGEVIVLTCDSAVTGTYLVVQLRGTNYLQLCEVEVFGQLGL